MIDNDINHLIEPFKTKVKVFMEIVKKKYPSLSPFETYRSRARQARLYSNNKKKGPVAKPGQSYHEKGLAVDRVFLYKGQPTWKGDYSYLHTVGFMCGMVPVKGESCHLQDNRISIKGTMLANSNRYNKTKSSTEQKLLSIVNTNFRSLGF